MFIFPTVKSLQKWVLQRKNNEDTIGFVPTMGALHQGHLSLVQQAKKQSNIVVVSIFVNPTQFNDKGDLDRYPRNEQADLEMLYKQGVDAVFLPSVEEVYPNGQQAPKHYDFGNLAIVMEGEHRAGHFDGVAQVVKRLLDIVSPHQLFMGQKDYQQVAIIRRLIELENLKVDLIPCPTVREENGLAMSSRNQLLTADEREIASNIYKSLTNLKNQYNKMDLQQAIKAAINQIEQYQPLKIEYLQVSNAYNLSPINEWADARELVACTAVYLGKVRLIDNVLIP